MRDLENLGIIRRSDSEWASPAHLVPKADGGQRVVGDFKELNKMTDFDQYPLPRMEDIFDQLHGKGCFSVLDLKRGYHQIPMAEEDIAKTAISTPDGLYEYLRMPFGLVNAGKTFQRFMHQVLQGMEGVHVYLDDILVATESQEGHARRVIEVLQRLLDNGLVVKASKMQLAVDKVKFLGHLVEKGGIIVPQEKVDAINDFEKPKNVRMLRRFLGMINFYRKFIKNAGELLFPLTECLKGVKFNTELINWGEAQEECFRKAKETMKDLAKLRFPDPNLDVHLTTEVKWSGGAGGGRGEVPSRLLL